MRQTGRPAEDNSLREPDYEAFLNRLADIASDAILPHFRAAPNVESKETDRFDPVTVADRAAEEAVRAAIASAFPDDGILGEEFGATNIDADKVWVIDPIDGTRSFIAGLPVWGVLIGLLQRGKPRLGMMAQPFTGERFFGDGENASYSGPDGRRGLRTRACSTIEDAVLFTTSPQDFGAADLATYMRVESRAKLARYGTDCYAYCMLAGGSVDAVIEAGLQPFDILPLVPIIEGAGGKVTDWQGNPPPDSGQILATGDAQLHAQILALLNSG